MNPPFRQVYDEHFRFVWRSLYRLGVSDSDVPDVLQEVFVVIHRKLESFEGNAKMTTWIFGICMRVASEYRRRVTSRPEAAIDAISAEVRDESGRDPVQQMMNQQRKEMLYRLLDKLPEDQRAVFVLFELEGLSGDEVAELVSAPVGTVRSRLRLAREAFRASLAREQSRDAARPMEVP